MRMYGGNGVVTISKLNFDTKCMLVGAFTLWPIYAKAKEPTYPCAFEQIWR